MSFKLSKSGERKAGVLLSYLHTGLGMIISLIYTPVMLRLMGQSEYGVYQAAASVISYLSLFSLGFSSSYMRFFARYKVKDDSEGIAKLNFLFAIVFGLAAVLSLIAGIILSSHSNLVFGSKFTPGEMYISRILLLVMGISMAVSFIDSIFSMYINALEKFTFQRIISLASLILRPTVTLPLLLMGHGAIGYAVVSASITVASTLSDILYAKKYGIQFRIGKPDVALLKEITVFSFFVFLTSLALTINATIDKLLLSRYVGANAVAIYEIGEKFNSYLIQLSITVSAVFIPTVNLMIAEKKSSEELTNLMIRIGRIQFILLAFVLGGFSIIGKYFIQMYAGIQYAESYDIAMVIMLASFVPYIQNIGIEIQKAYNKHIFRSLVYFLISLMNIIISIPLIREYGIRGAAIGTAISLLLGNTIIMNIYYARGIHLNMLRFWKELGNPIICASISIAFGLLLKRLLPVSSILIFFIHGIAFSIVYVMVMWRYGTNGDEKSLFTTLLGKIAPHKI